ncbi:acetyl-CoA C-acetyltransferase [Bacillus sp. FJAT-45350]|uniref:acetyl-CoA C-acetyltransferase n=1 Tax=Bacillus sp. FJAT-45350 TaxID=2011014 RepID=UPI000BB87507|nr:acetyl-CoA C-acetyltransferase [Bacillus sp. FJAT-45350]
MQDIYILNGSRTPFGSFTGSLKCVEATKLGEISAKEALIRANVLPEEIDNIVYGNVIHSDTNAAYLARHIGLKTGVPQSTPALTVNRLCGSGLQAVISAAQSMLTRDSKIALVGGAENMSRAPYSHFTHRFQGQKMGNLEFQDMLTGTLTDNYCKIGMGITAENLAEKFNITREAQDNYALLSQTRTETARLNRELQAEITPITIKNRDGTTTVIDQDEHPKPQASLVDLSRLKPAFKKDGTVTAGNASGINDGAASLVIADEDYIKRNEKKPLCKIVSWGISGVDPAHMGIGPVPAIQSALKKAGLMIKDIDLFEINEAFAAQYLAVEKELGLDQEKTNVNGGAIALGHPVGASGTRILLTLAYQLQRRGLKFGVASLCIGGGQGIAMIIQNMQK